MHIIMAGIIIIIIISTFRCIRLQFSYVRQPLAMLLLLISFSAVAAATALRVCDCCNRLSIVCILLGPLLDWTLLSPYDPLLLLDGWMLFLSLPVMMMMIQYWRAQILSCLVGSPGSTTSTMSLQ